MTQEYFAVGNKCAINLSSWQLPVSEEKALALLWRKGFRVIKVDMIARARKCIGSSRYHRGAHIDQAPFVVDCSTLTKWLYGKVGIWLPRHSVDQAEMGRFVGLNLLEAGDLVFTQGAQPYFRNPAKKVGHVGLVTEAGTIIHAANSRVGIIEQPIGEFVGSKFTTVRRIMEGSVITLECPSNRMVERSGQIRNIILMNLGG